MSPIVAVFNTNDDLVEALSQILEEEGFTPVTGHITDFERGKKDLEAFLQKHDPRVIIFDVAPPYLEHWRFLRLAMSSHWMDGRGLVVTTTNKKQLEAEARSGGEQALEILGKPYDLQKVVDAVRAALQRISASDHTARSD